MFPGPLCTVAILSEKAALRTIIVGDDLQVKDQ